MRIAKVYQGFHDDKNVEEHCSRTTIIDRILVYCRRIIYIKRTIKDHK